MPTNISQTIFVFNTTGWPASVSALSNIQSVVTNVLQTTYQDNMAQVAVTASPAGPNLVDITITGTSMAHTNLPLASMVVLNTQIAQGHP